MNEPYRVEQDDPGCDTCGHGKTWVIVGPNDTALGLSWGENSEGECPDEPCYFVGYLNAAYALGAESSGECSERCPGSWQIKEGGVVYCAQPKGHEGPCAPPKPKS